jgi:hypothetical protein
MNLQGRRVNRKQASIECSMVVCAEYQSISRIVCPLSKLRTNVRGVKQFRDRHPANDALWSVTLKDAELETLLPRTPLHFSSASLFWR